MPVHVWICRSKAAKWRAEMGALDAKVGEIEHRVEALLRRAFSQLTCSRAAFELLERFRASEVRPSLRALLLANSGHIVEKAREELAEAAALFAAQKDSPPLERHSPPVAGAIAWANSLYHRQKEPILRFKCMPHLLASHTGEALKREYLHFARAVDGYVKGLHSDWCDEVEAAVPELLRQPVLGPELLPSPPKPRDILAAAVSASSLPTGVSFEGGAEAQADPTTVAGASPSGLVMATASAAAAAQQYPALSIDRDALLLPPPPYFVNFSPQLETVIREAKALDQLGYPVPPSAVNVALQEGKLEETRARLQAMLDRYHATLEGLSPVEANLLQLHLARLRCAVRPGFVPLNWNSLHSGAYVGDVLRSLQDFDNTLSQVRKSCAVLQGCVDAIASTVLLDVPALLSRAPLEAAEAFELMEAQRASAVGHLVARYRSVRPVMLQVEGHIAGTDTAASPALAEFYRFWERKFYNAITTMVLRSLATLQALLGLVTSTPPPSIHMGCISGSSSSGLLLTADAAAEGQASITSPSSSASGPLATPPPLLKVTATLSAPDVVLSPDLAHIAKFLRRAVDELLRSACAFTRWMDGTCMEVQVQLPASASTDVSTSGGRSAPGGGPDFSYYEDIKHNPEVVRVLMALNPAVSNYFLVN